MQDTLCPKLEETLHLLSKKWVGLIVFSLLDKPKKFSEIEQFIPHISARMLTKRLKELEQNGIVVKHIYNDNHVHIEYRLSKKGIDLSSMFQSIAKWSEKWN